jgi:hypothetical protein
MFIFSISRWNAAMVSWVARGETAALTFPITAAVWPTACIALACDAIVFA